MARTGLLGHYLFGAYVSEGLKQSTKTQHASGAGRSKPTSKSKLESRLPTCSCLYAFEAQDSDELGFNKGDVIEILEEDPSGWWHGKLRGKEGLFPASYVQKHPSEVDPTLPKAICVYAYKASDLSMNKGDVIQIIHDEDPSGWWRGKLRGKEGLFPAPYVRKL